jgi:DNA-binding NarL/FixJ family response regulator
MEGALGTEKEQGAEQHADAPVRVLLVDGQPVYRAGLATILGAAGFAVVGEAHAASEAAAAALATRPDLVLLDSQLPGAMAACRALARGRLLVLTPGGDDRVALACLRAGAAGAACKTSAPGLLVQAAAAVARGGAFLDPALHRAILAALRGEDEAGDPRLAALSPREREMLPLIAAGRTNREIAAALGLSEHTAKSYVGEILARRGLRRRAEAAAFIARIEAGGVDALGGAHVAGLIESGEGDLSKNFDNSWQAAALSPLAREDPDAARAVWGELATEGGRAAVPGGATGGESDDDPRLTLTPREREVLRLAGTGLREAEIADRLKVSRPTVRKTMGAVKGKLGLRAGSSLETYVTDRVLRRLPLPWAREA